MVYKRGCFELSKNYRENNSYSREAFLGIADLIIFSYNIGSYCIIF